MRFTRSSFSPSLIQIFRRWLSGWSMWASGCRGCLEIMGKWLKWCGLCTRGTMRIRRRMSCLFLRFPVWLGVRQSGLFCRSFRNRSSTYLRTLRNSARSSRPCTWTNLNLRNCKTSNFMKTRLKTTSWSRWHKNMDIKWHRKSNQSMGITFPKSWSVPL